jgi:hypothetical protein
VLKPIAMIRGSMAFLVCLIAACGEHEGKATQLPASCFVEGHISRLGTAPQPGDSWVTCDEYTGVWGKAQIDEVKAGCADPVYNYASTSATTYKHTWRDGRPCEATFVAGCRKKEPAAGQNAYATEWYQNDRAEYWKQFCDASQGHEWVTR